MLENQKIRPDSVVGPLGERLTLDMLPPLDTRRWTARRKAEIAAAVKGGMITIDEACEMYKLTLEELVSWERSLDRSGMAGLRITRIQDYKQSYERRNRY